MAFRHKKVRKLNSQQKSSLLQTPPGAKPASGLPLKPKHNETQTYETFLASFFGQLSEAVSLNGSEVMQLSEAVSWLFAIKKEEIQIRILIFDF